MIRKILLYLVYFALIIFAVVLVVKDYNDHKVKTAKPKVSQSQKTHTEQKSPAKKQDSGASGPSRQQSSKTQNAAPQSSQQSSGAKKSVPTSTGSIAATNLANSGPGSVIAIFIGASILGAFGFSWYQRRQLVDTL